MNGMFRISRMAFFEGEKGGTGGGAAGDAGAGGTEDKGAGDGGKGAPVTYDKWFASQPDDVKALITDNEKNLKTALQSERDARGKLESDLRDAAKKAEAGSENQKKLTDLADQISESNRKATFYETAITAGVNDLKLAYLAAKEGDLFKKDGTPDLEALKKSHPGLFGAARKTNGAGSGTDTEPPAEKDMNSFIRRSSGR